MLDENGKYVKKTEANGVLQLPLDRISAFLYYG